MKATSNYPIYTAVAVASDGTEYKLQNVTTDLLLDELDKCLAQSLTLSLRNAKVGKGYLSDCITDDMRFYVYANDGKKKEEVFRGFIWDYNGESSLEKTIKIKAYDNLIFPQKSKDCLYFSAGKYTKSLITTICNKWGIKIVYSYDEIKHPKLPFNNKYIADIFIEILDAVKKKKGTKYVIRSEKDVFKFKKTGSNSEVYTFEAKRTAISTKKGWSKDNLVTQVVIYGNEDDDERRSIEATVKRSNSSKYGTLQDVVTMSGNTTLAEAKEEANEILDENGKPEVTESFEGPDVPWVHKGDLVKIKAGDLAGSYIVKSISHDALRKRMTMEVEKK